MNNQLQDPDPICCPPFDPALWDDKIHEWNRKRFIRDRVFTLFYMPFGFGRAMKRLDGQLTAAGAAMQDNLCLSDHTSMWNMDLWLAVDREVPGARNDTLSGKFYCKVYEGPFGDTGKWCKDFAAILKSKALKQASEKLYMWYTTCPKCAKKYGKNYVAILAKIENS